MNTTEQVLQLKQQHIETWRDKPESYWFARLTQEVGELGSSLVGDHDDPPERELKQIAAICLNWLEYRAAIPTNKPLQTICTLRKSSELKR